MTSLLSNRKWEWLLNVQVVSANSVKPAKNKLCCVHKQAGDLQAKIQIKSRGDKT